MNAAEKVTAYLRENLSEMVRGGQPRREPSSGQWHVPAVSHADDQPVVLGEYVLDAELHFVDNPIEEIMDRFSDQLSRLEDAREGSAEDDPQQQERGDAALSEIVGGRCTLEETADELGLVDSLTGLGTPAACLMRIEQELARSSRYRSRFCVLAIDVDHLDRVNEGLGPLIGDALIRHVGRDLEGVVRDTDFLGRWCGGTFIAIVQGGRREVRVAANRLRLSVQKQQYIPAPGQDPLPVTISIGAAPCPGSTQRSPSALIAAATDMLTAAKAAGGNKTMLGD